MKVTKVMVNRKFNLGNYETLDMAAEAELNDTDNPLEIWQVLRDNIEMEYIAMQNKTKPTPTSKPQPTPQPQPKQSSQGESLKGKFKDETLQHILIQLNGDITTKEYIHDKALWARINDDLKANGYVWVSAGAKSHWELKQ